MTYISVKSSIKNNPAARLMPDKGLEGLCPEREDRVGPACALEVSALFVCRAGIKGHKEWGGVHHVSFLSLFALSSSGRFLTATASAGAGDSFSSVFEVL